MKDKKTSTFVYRGLGFPIKLINAPMRKEFGKWFIHINFNKLQLLALEMLVHKPAPISYEELGFIRAYLEMTDTQFSKLLGISRATLAEWENNKAKIPPPLDLYIRLHALNHLEPSDKDFRTLFNSLSLEQLSKKRKTKMFAIDASKHLKAVTLT